MGVLWWLVLGVLVGLAARWLVPGQSAAGVPGDVLAGILGALAGGWLFRLLGHADVSGFNLPSIVCAGIGAVVLLYIVRARGGRSA